MGASLRIALAMDILCFSPPERVEPPSAYHRVIAIFERGYKLVAAGLFAGFDNLFLRCALFSESDVVENGIVKKIHILKNRRLYFQGGFPLSLL